MGAWFTGRLLEQMKKLRSGGLTVMEVGTRLGRLAVSPSITVVSNVEATKLTCGWKLGKRQTLTKFATKKDRHLQRCGEKRGQSLP